MMSCQIQQIQKLRRFLNTKIMKNTSSQKLRLGLFVILGTVLFIVGVYLIGQRQNMFKKTFTISTYFQNVNGLQHGNNVRYSGIDIGTVKDITMVNDSTIKVEMAIDEKIIRLPGCVFLIPTHEHDDVPRTYHTVAIKIIRRTIPDTSIGSHQQREICDANIAIQVEVRR